MTTNTNKGVQTPATSSESTKTPVLAMPKSLQPRLCVQRDDNTVVPLVAMDELPDSVILKGVPVKLTVLDALKARMELITGDYPAHGVRYELDRPINTHRVASGQSDDSGSDGSPTSEGSGSSPQKAFTASDKKGNKNAKDKALRQPTLTTNDKSIIDPMANKGTIGKKVYCTYWIQTGNCNYMQEGCKYKHEIPKDEETRRAIGFREFPNWPREEMPIRPATALHKSWRRQDGKHEFPGSSGPSHRGVAAPAAANGTPSVLPRSNSQPSAGPSAQTATAGNMQYNPKVNGFTAPHQHFPTHVNSMVQQRAFSQGGPPFLGNGAAENYQQRQPQNNASPPSYTQSATQMLNGGRSGSSTPPKQPPISRPTNLGQSSVHQQHNNTGMTTRRVAPDHHIGNRANGTAGGNTSAASGNPAQINPRPVYSGMHNNWNPQTNAPTSMDISFIAPPSESTRSGSHTVYTPNFTPDSASATPTVNNGNAFANLNRHVKPGSRAGTPAHINSNAFANNGNASVKGRGPVHFGRNSPNASTASANHPMQTSTVAEESDATSITSPPVMHRVFFPEPGQPEYVTNTPEPKTGKAAHGAKKHGKKAHGAANGGKSAKNKMSGNGYDLLVDEA